MKLMALGMRCLFSVLLVSAMWAAEAAPVNAPDNEALSPADVPNNEAVSSIAVLTVISPTVSKDWGEAKDEASARFSRYINDSILNELMKNRNFTVVDSLTVENRMKDAGISIGDVYLKMIPPAEVCKKIAVDTIVMVSVGEFMGYAENKHTISVYFIPVVSAKKVKYRMQLMAELYEDKIDTTNISGIGEKSQSAGIGWAIVNKDKDMGELLKKTDFMSIDWTDSPAGQATQSAVINLAKATQRTVPAHILSISRDGIIEIGIGSDVDIKVKDTFTITQRAEPTAGNDAAKSQARILGEVKVISVTNKSCLCKPVKPFAVTPTTNDLAIYMSKAKKK